MAFEQIAIGQQPRSSRKVLQPLLDRGLIERGEDKFIARDHFGDIKIPQYFVPLPIHAQWCKWCAAHQQDEAK